MKFYKYTFILFLLLAANVGAQAQCITTSVPLDSSIIAFSVPECAVTGQPYQGGVSGSITTAYNYNGNDIDICQVRFDSLAWDNGNTLSLTAEFNGTPYSAGQYIPLNMVEPINNFCLNLSGNTITTTTNYPGLYASVKLYASTQNCAGNPLAVVPLTALNNGMPIDILLEVVNDITLCPSLQDEFITGSVVYDDPSSPGNDTATCGTVYFYDPAANPSVPVDSLELASTAPFHWLPTGNGPYTARYVPCGALVNSVGAMPTYYPSAAFGANADTLSVGTANPNIFHLLQDTAQLQGPVTITGFIYDGAKADKALGVPDVSVFLKNTADDIIAYTQTNASGKYTFTDLPYGTYVVYPEIPGVTTTPYTVTVNAGDSTEFLASFIYAGDEITPIISQAGITEPDVLSVRVAPNPTADVAYLSLHSMQGQTIRAYMADMQGKTVWQYGTAVGKGQQTLTLDFSAVVPGVYSLHIGGNKWNTTRKIVIAR